MNELPIPPDASATQTQEVLRVWIVDQEQLECTLQADAFPDAETWGVVLADVIRNLGRALLELEGKDTRDTTQRVLKELQKELETAQTPAEDGIQG
jgi:hypothetical protein